MQPGQLITAADIEAMLKVQGLEKRGLMPGDVLYIYTGWGDHWKDPDVEKFYYTKGPVSPMTQLATSQRSRSCCSRSTIRSPIPWPKVSYKAKLRRPGRTGGPAVCHPSHEPRGSWHLPDQNANLGALAQDRVWLSCTIILPLRAQEMPARR